MDKKIAKAVMDCQVKQAKYIIETLISRIMLQNLNGDYPSYHIVIPYGTSCDDEYDYSLNDDIVRSLCRALMEYSPSQVSAAMSAVVEGLEFIGYLVEVDMDNEDGSINLTIAMEERHE